MPETFRMLSEHPVNDAERERVYETFDMMMTSLDRQAEEDVIPGSNIRVTDKYKIKFYKAYYVEFRD